MNKQLIGASGLAIAAVFLLAFNIVADTALQGAKLDLTENKLYTLSEGSKNIVKNLDEPVTLKFFFSRKLGNEAPALSDYARRVRELLQEYEDNSGGKLDLQEVDPEPFSEAEEEAVRAGIQGIPISQQERLYFGLQGLNTVDGKRVIPFFSPEKEQFLEYDISELIYDLANPRKPKVTIVTNLPIDGSQDPMAAMMDQQNQQQPWVIYDELTRLYEVEVVPSSTEEVPADTDLLMLIHPKNLSDSMQYSIDQFVLGGGKAIVYVDPLAEIEEVPQNPQNPMQAMSQPKNSDLPKLFEAWGVELVPEEVVGDRENAQTVVVGSRTNPEYTDYVLYLRLGGDLLNNDEFVTSNLDGINLATAGAFRVLDDAGTEVIPLLQTSSDSMMIPVSKAQMFPQPKEMLRDFESENEQKLIAALISGKAKTAFPDGPPAAESEEGEEAEPVSDPDQLKEASGSIQVAVISDVDMLADRSWVQIQQFFNMRIPNIMASNGQFASNLVDFLSGSDDLISIRGRGEYQRPFTVVEEMEDEAREASAEQIANLQQKLEETEQRLRELQSQAPEGDPMQITSSELESEIEKFELQRVETRRELRRLELSLRQDVESLGQRLKFINIGLIPILVGLIAVGLGTVRVNRRRRR